MRKSAAAAAALYRRTYDAGHGPSENNLGLSYRQGVDVKRGDAQANACFTRAVALQNFDGAVNTTSAPIVISALAAASALRLAFARTKRCGRLFWAAAFAHKFFALCLQVRDGFPARSG